MRRSLAAMAWGLTVLLTAVLAGSCKPRSTSSQVLSDVQGTSPEQIRTITGWDCPAYGPIRVAFFDADSTLRVAKSGNVSANSADDVLILPFVALKLASLAKDGFLVAIVSNQMGVSQGHVSAESAAGGLLFASRQIARLGGTVHHIDMAEADDNFRKPKTGMATRLDEAIKAKCNGRGFSVPDSFMVGDSGYLMPRNGKPGDGPHPDGRPADDFSNADRLFAKNVFAPNSDLTAKNFQEPTDFFGWKAYGVFNIANPKQLEDFLISIEGAAHRARAEQQRDRADALEQEVKGLREVNGMAHAL